MPATKSNPAEYVEMDSEVRGGCDIESCCYSAVDWEGLSMNPIAFLAQCFLYVFQSEISSNNKERILHGGQIHAIA